MAKFNTAGSEHNRIHEVFLHVRNEAVEDTVLRHSVEILKLRRK